eukprot:CAMPEP_0119362870 /NCGR_PEP_ID=MMETSP1334-20130426/9781_1 /TAXON_ID=127549 /ORGANISM="Calcidiscus leptoporus, Strain RCC1130" /LENGTH=171 /DNA_ID=CAMNT_0007378135 /DNA_START=283 /DNA_END=795 /DNA_ORIENTATION=+
MENVSDGATAEGGKGADKRGGGEPNGRTPIRRGSTSKNMSKNEPKARASQQAHDKEKGQASSLSFQHPGWGKSMTSRSQSSPGNSLLNQSGPPHASKSFLPADNILHGVWTVTDSMFQSSSPSTQMSIFLGSHVRIALMSQVSAYPPASKASSFRILLVSPPNFTDATSFA